MTCCLHTFLLAFNVAVNASRTHNERTFSALGGVSRDAHYINARCLLAFRMTVVHTLHNYFWMQICRHHCWQHCCDLCYFCTSVYSHFKYIYSLITIMYAKQDWFCLGFGFTRPQIFDTWYDDGVYRCLYSYIDEYDLWRQTPKHFRLDQSWW